MKYFIIALLVFFNFSLLSAQPIPTVEDAIEYFERLDEPSFKDSEKAEVKYFTQNFIFYNLPIGAGKESKMRQLVDILIEKKTLQNAYPEVFIEFFYKSYDKFNESEIRKISLVLGKIIKGDDVAKYNLVIGRYQLKGFTEDLRSFLPKNGIKEMENSITKYGELIDYWNLRLITSLANLDNTTQDSLLNLIRHAYDLINNQNENTFFATQYFGRKRELYGLIVPRTLKYLIDYKEVISRTLYLLNEEMIFPRHGDQPGVDCAYQYFSDLILPHLIRNKKAGNYMGKTHPNDPIKGFFEDHRTPELMRAALIEFGILEK